MPGIVLMAPSDEVELMHAVATAAALDDRASAFRYPRGEVLVTIEEGSSGGFGAAVMQHLAWRGLLDGGLRVRPMTLPDRFIEQDTQARQLANAGLTARDIVATVLNALGTEVTLNAAADRA